MAFWPYPADVARLPRESTFLCDNKGLPLAEFTAPDGQWRTVLSENEISPHLFDAIVAVEDARFFQHHGVDWSAVAAAAWQDALSLRARRGASTISMQLHRLRVPTSHSMWGKLEQAIRATQLERRQSKRAILVEYLNRAPFGGNLVGAGAASWRYFGRPCRDLSLAQAALLAALPKNPTSDRPDRFPQRARARRDFVLNRMLALHQITPEAHRAALAEPIDASWRALPQHNDPSIEAALPTLARLAAQFSVSRIQTTLDRATQQLAATAARDYLDQQEGRISEIAVVVVDTASARCLASVSLSRSGAKDVDLTRRPRSTGSVIKPLLYAAAFDSGISSPQSILDDSPAAWPGYIPANYDQEFRGRMTASEALAQSRNIPALRILQRVGVARAAGVCGALGLRTLSQTPQRYGLSLAVGGAEAAPFEIAEAFASLARGGRHRGLSLCSDTVDQDPGGSHFAAALSERACRQTLDCLNDPRRTATVCPEAAPLHVAWKTGTSSGHRDAWCAAVGPARVVVVWMGNANGSGAADLIGGEAAAPVALRLIAAIDAQVPPVPLLSPRRPAPAMALALPTYAPEELTIVAPANHSTILIEPELHLNLQKVQLRASTLGAMQTASLFWFVDGAPLGAANSSDPFWWSPTPGSHEIRVIDPIGRADQITLSVVTPLKRP